MSDIGSSKTSDFVEIAQFPRNNSAELSEFLGTTYNASQARIQYKNVKKRRRRSSQLYSDQNSFQQKQLIKNATYDQLTVKMPRPTVQRSSAWRETDPRSRKTWRVEDLPSSAIGRKTDPRSSDIWQVSNIQSNTGTGEADQLNGAFLWETDLGSSFSQAEEHNPRNSTAPREADVRISDRQMMNWWIRTKKKTRGKVAGSQSTKLDIQELVRSSERMRYLTKRERLALIRGILASDQADEIAFLAGAEN
jgi:hypothetical protein